MIKARTDAHLAVLQVRHVADPALQAVKDVGRVHDRGAALLALAAEEGEQVLAAQHVHVHCDLIHQQHLQGMRLRISEDCACVTTRANTSSRCAALRTGLCTLHLAHKSLLTS